MNVFFFNCRGFAKPAKVLKTLTALQEHANLSESIICLQETKINYPTQEHLAIFNSFKLNVQYQESNHQSGGLAVLYPIEWSAEIVFQSFNIIAILFQQQNAVIANVYINPKDQKLNELNKLAEKLSVNDDYEIIIGGDFNAIDRKDNLSKHVPNNDIRINRFKKVSALLQSVSCEHFKLLLHVW